jgi:hypothetical protein
MLSHALCALFLLAVLKHVCVCVVSGAVDLWIDDAPAYGRNGTAYSCELYGSAAAETVSAHSRRQEQHRKAPRHQPLFLMLSMQQTHQPFQCPARYTDSAIGHRGRRAFQCMTTCIDAATTNVTRCHTALCLSHTHGA